MKEYKYKINGNDYKVVVGDIDGNIANVEVNGNSYKVELEKAPVAAKPVIKRVAASAAPAPAAAAPAPRPAAGGAVGAVTSPLPGTVLDIKFKVGDSVKASDCVLILEAMKMENNINAGKDGVIKSINVNKGDSVLEGTPLFVLG